MKLADTGYCCLRTFMAFFMFRRFVEWKIRLGPNQI